MMINRTCSWIPYLFRFQSLWFQAQLRFAVVWLCPWWGHWVDSLENATLPFPMSYTISNHSWAGLFHYYTPVKSRLHYQLTCCSRFIARSLVVPLTFYCNRGLLWGWLRDPSFGKYTSSRLTWFLTGIRSIVSSSD